MPAGRPSTFDQAIADEICERIANGERYTQIQASAGDGWFPSRWTLARWMEDNEKFRTIYARARLVAAEAREEECSDIVAAATVDDVHLARLRWDNAKWQAKVGNPAKYGDKVQAEHSGPNGAPIETVTRIEMVPVEPRRRDDSAD